MTTKTKTKRPAKRAAKKTTARGSAVARQVPPKRPKRASKRAVSKPAVKKVVRRTVKRPAEKAAPKRTKATRVASAARLYQSFHGEAPAKVQRIKHREVKEAMSLGRLQAVTYLTPDGKLYRHEFVGAARPILASSHDGRQLIVLGGRYRMTWRGIVDQRKR